MYLIVSRGWISSRRVKLAKIIIIMVEVVGIISGFCRVVSRKLSRSYKDSKIAIIIIIRPGL